MLGYLAIIVTSFLWTALIAFGWQPCCCVSEVTVSCCANPIPETLHFTVTVTSGTCALVDGYTTTMTYSAGSTSWSTAVGAPWDTNFQYTMQCLSGSWFTTFNMTGACQFTSISAISVTCPSGATPFSAFHTATFGGGSCSCGAISVRIDITE